MRHKGLQFPSLHYWHSTNSYSTILQLKKSHHINKTKQLHSKNIMVLCDFFHFIMILCHFFSPLWSGQEEVPGQPVPQQLQGWCPAHWPSVWAPVIRIIVVLFHVAARDKHFQKRRNKTDRKGSRTWRNTKFRWRFPGLSDVSMGHVLHRPARPHSEIHCCLMV